MNYDEILSWILETDPQRLESLWEQADDTRKKSVGEQVHLRGLIEISNICRRQCLYCGIRAGNSETNRYRLSLNEVLDSARLAVRFGYGSIVIQSGEDPGLTSEFIAECVRAIRGETELAITLSLGEQDEKTWELWKKAGADRYLLRFETSNVQLYHAIHPGFRGVSEVYAENTEHPRLGMLRKLREIGFEIGSGIMVGIPGQKYTDLVNDLLLFQGQNLDMIGLGPFLPHPNTPLGKIFPGDERTGMFTPAVWNTDQLNFFNENQIDPPSLENQVSPSEVLVFKMIALARMLCPLTNIPSTTAVATIDTQNGRKLGLSRGANVVMPNLTPKKYRIMYEIYPNKAASFLTPEETDEQVKRHITEVSRTPGTGRGDSINYIGCEQNENIRNKS
ncbi:MAG: radical SAM protein [Thermoguttaceae bacterium]